MKSEHLNKNRRVKYYILAILFVLSGVILDQITKYFAVLYLKDQKPFVILDGVFELFYLENRGAAFGMLQGMQLFFLICVIVITGFIIWFFWHVPLEKKYIPLCVCAAAVLAGAYGNGIDRVRQGFVVDFFYFKLIDFPVFNVADIYVTVSVVFLAVLCLFFYKEEDFERIFHRGK